MRSRKPHPLRLGEDGHDASRSALTRAKRGDVDAARAGGAAVAARPVLREVNEDVIAVIGVADAQPVEFSLPNDVHECHRSLDDYPIGERYLGQSRVQVVVPFVVSNELRHRMRVTEDRVHLGHETVRIQLPEAAQPRAHRAHLLELAGIPPTAAGPSPLRDEPVQVLHGTETVPGLLLGVHQCCRGSQRNLGVMSEEHLDILHLAP